MNVDDFLNAPLEHEENPEDILTKAIKAALVAGGGEGLEPDGFVLMVDIRDEDGNAATTIIAPRFMSYAHMLGIARYGYSALEESGGLAGWGGISLDDED